MTGGPELIIGYAEDSFPSTAVCSGCGKHMPLPESPLATSTDYIHWFASQFSAHMQERHSKCAPAN